MAPIHWDIHAQGGICVVDSFTHCSSNGWLDLIPKWLILKSWKTKLKRYKETQKSQTYCVLLLLNTMSWFLLLLFITTVKPWLWTTYQKNSPERWVLPLIWIIIESSLFMVNDICCFYQLQELLSLYLAYIACVSMATTVKLWWLKAGNLYNPHPRKSCQQSQRLYQNTKSFPPESCSKH